MKKLCILCYLIFATVAFSQIPQTMSYQGVLTDAQGNAVADGSYSLTFNLYESATGGSSIWGETQDIAVVNGVFNAILGSVTPLSNSFDRPYWLGIAIGSDAELEPRIELTASAYSLNARSVADNAVTRDKIAAGQVVKSINELTDTITLKAMGGATITTSNDTITINAGSGGGGTGIQGVQNTNNTLDILDPNGPTATINVKEGGIGSEQLAGSAVTGDKIADGEVVRSLNGVTDDVALAAGENINLSVDGQTVTISASGQVAESRNTLDAADGDPVDAVFVDDDGKVGIGTTTPAQQLDITGNLQLPATATDSGDSVGIIMVDGKRFIHNFGSNNFFAGVSAGNLTMTGGGNTASGAGALAGNTTGGGNTASGAGALAGNTTGLFNTASGVSALRDNTTGDDNTASGASALSSNTEGDFNTASGRRALRDNTRGSDNTASGAGALFSNTTGNSNTASGRNALEFNTTGSNNTAIGYNADVALGNLTNATAFGANAVVDASNKIRLGNVSVTVVETTGEYHSTGGGFRFPDGTLQTTAASAGGWDLSGNAGTDASSNFLGTTDDQALELRVNNQRVLRLEPAGGAPNIIAGDSSNSVDAGVQGGTISGGGPFSSGTPGNRVTANYGTVGGGQGNTASGLSSTVGGGENNSAEGEYNTVSGGRNNVARGTEDGFVTVGGGSFNQALSDHATVAGGASNTASGSQSFIGGGRLNVATAQRATIAGGNENHATQFAAAIGGGDSNVASGQAATVPGGDRNHARGDYSFAAGYKARAIHEGSFVWNDRSVTNFNDSLVTTANNQFLIRAAGGVGIGTTNPGGALHVVDEFSSTNSVESILLIERRTTGTPANGIGGAIEFRTERQAGVFQTRTGRIMSLIQTNANTNNDRHSLAFEVRNNDTFVEGMRIRYDGNVGVGTTNPTEKLHVIGNALADAHITPSSRRWKTNIKTIANPLETVQALRGVTYDWKESGKHDIGLIAEEVGEVIPEIVAYEENGVDAKSVDYSRLVAVLIEAAKEQLVLIDNQNKALQKLAARVIELEKQHHRPSLVQK